MKKSLSMREKTALVGALAVVFVLALDVGWRAWSPAFDSLRREEQSLQAEWQHASGLLARGHLIESRFQALKLRYPGLFAFPMDQASDLLAAEAAAKAAGVVIQNARPARAGDRGNVIELSFRGTWPQIARAISDLEGPAHMFQLMSLSIEELADRQELAVLATLEK